MIRQYSNFGQIGFSLVNGVLTLVDDATQTEFTLGSGSLGSDLAALAAISTTGLYTITGAGTSATRTITGTSNQITVTNASGVSGNPTLSTPQNIHTSATPQFGRLGLGVAADATIPLFVQSQDNVDVAVFKINTASANVTTADTFISFQTTDGEVGDISGTAVAGTIVFSTFTGGHWSQWDGTPPVNPQIGSVLVSTGNMCKWPGKAAILPKCAFTTTAKDKAVYGVYIGQSNNKVSTGGLGAGVIRVNTSGGNIAIGDFLCTSTAAGEAMKYPGIPVPNQLFDDMRVIVAKARQPWNGPGVGTIACTLIGG